MSLVFTADHDAGVVQVAVLEGLGSVMRPLRSWSLFGLGKFGYAHRSALDRRRTFKIGPLLGMA
jgi:hypothetical protein